MPLPPPPPPPPNTHTHINHNLPNKKDPPPAQEEFAKDLIHKVLFELFYSEWSYKFEKPIWYFYTLNNILVWITPPPSPFLQNFLISLNIFALKTSELCTKSAPFFCNILYLKNIFPSEFWTKCSFVLATFYTSNNIFTWVTVKFVRSAPTHPFATFVYLKKYLCMID